MIISASRRTDIPAFYSRWFLHRVRSGYCTVPNPFNRQQVSHVSLRPEDVEVIVFWSRNPKPLFSGLDELDSRGFRYYFLFTIVNNPSPIDPYTPAVKKSVRTFIELADRIGPEKVIWRYDPIVFSNRTPPPYHIENFRSIAESLKGYAQRSVISIVESYPKTNLRIRNLEKGGICLTATNELPEGSLGRMLESLVAIAGENGMALTSCAGKIDFAQYGIRSGKCIDDNLVRKSFRLDVAGRKDPCQRKECRCVASRDIGMYDSCLFGCAYCYATRNFVLSRRHHKAHDPKSPSLLGWHDAEPAAAKKSPESGRPGSKVHQLTLF